MCRELASSVWRWRGGCPIVAAVVVGVGSFLQGFGPPLVAQRLTGAVRCRAAAGVGGVCGYAWPARCWRGGGRAVGTTTGALAALDAKGLVPLLSRR